MYCVELVLLSAAAFMLAVISCIYGLVRLKFRLALALAAALAAATPAVIRSLARFSAACCSGVLSSSLLLTLARVSVGSVVLLGLRCLALCFHSGVRAGVREEYSFKLGSHIGEHVDRVIAIHRC